MHTCFVRLKTDEKRSSAKTNVSLLKVIVRRGHFGAELVKRIIGAIAWSFGDFHREANLWPVRLEVVWWLLVGTLTCQAVTPTHCQWRCWESIRTFPNQWKIALTSPDQWRLKLSSPLILCRCLSNLKKPQDSVAAEPSFSSSGQNTLFRRRTREGSPDPLTCLFFISPDNTVWSVVHERARWVVVTPFEHGHVGGWALLSSSLRSWSIRSACQGCSRAGLKYRPNRRRHARDETEKKSVTNCVPRVWASTGSSEHYLSTAVPAVVARALVCLPINTVMLPSRLRISNRPQRLQIRETHVTCVFIKSQAKKVDVLTVRSVFFECPLSTSSVVSRVDWKACA